MQQGVVIRGPFKTCDPTCGQFRLGYKFIWIVKRIAVVHLSRA